MEKITLIIVVIHTVAYALTAIYQANKFKALENTVNSQQKLIQDFEKYKSLFDIDDFEKRLNLKLDNQKLELTRSFVKQAEELANNIATNAAERMLEGNKDLLAAYNELSPIILVPILKKFPNESDKLQRDSYILSNHPKNAAYFINFFDLHFKKDELSKKNHI